MAFEETREMNREQVCNDAYQEYVHQVKGYLYKQINNRDDADDVCQDVFFSFWKSLEEFRGDSTPSTYLYVIRKRRFMDYLRKKYKNPLNILFALSQDEAAILILRIEKNQRKE